MPLALDKSGALHITERDVTHAVIQRLQHHGWTCRRLQSGLFQRPGGKGRVRIGERSSADWECLRAYPIESPPAGKVEHFYLEFKRPGKAATQAQSAWMDEQTARGFVCVVIASYEEFDRWYAGRWRL